MSQMGTRHDSSKSITLNDPVSKLQGIMEKGETTLGAKEA